MKIPCANSLLTLACVASFTLVAAEPAAKSAAKPAAAKPAPAVAKVDYWQPYTMMAAASKAIQDGETLPGGQMFAAALAADWTGDAVKSRDFLTYLVDKEKGDSPEVRRALVRLCLAGGSPKCYERYLSLMPHDLDGLALGVSQLMTLAQDGKGREFAQQLYLLLENYPQTPEVDEVARAAFWAVHERDFGGISDGKGALQALARAKKWKLTTRMMTFIERSNGNNREAREFYEIWQARKGEKWSRPFLERLVENPATSEDDGVEICRQIVSLYGVDRKHPEHYLDRFRRLTKHPRWMALLNDARQGAFPEEDKDKGFNPFAANRLLSKWVEEYNGKKFEGKPEEALKRAKEVLGERHTWDFEYWDDLRRMCEGCSLAVMANPKAASLYPFEEFARFAFERIVWDAKRTEAATWLMRAYDAAGKLDEGFARIRKAAEAAGTANGVATRRLALACMAECKERNWKTFLADAEYDWETKTLKLPEPKRDRLAWNLEIVKRYAKAPVPEHLYLCDTVGVWWETYWRVIEGAREAKRELTDAEKRYLADADAFLTISGRCFYPNGSRRAEYQWGMSAPVERLLYKRVKENPKDANIPFYAATCSLYRRGDRGDIVRCCNTLMSNDCVEVAYMLASCHRDIETAADLQLVRNEAASRMPGLYPVNDTDPAYPLYVAADALQRNNPERAWTLLSANTKVFDKDPMRYQPQFALWALDQYRKVRGPNDALRDKAWEHVETLLQKEASFPTEIAAGLFLLRAQIAEDRMNYEVAHAGYQAIRNHAQYQKTKAGRQAMFRDVELMMTMGSADAAAQVAEQWVTMPEPEVRAQGHYILAKIAFGRKDYDETRKELDKVFEVDFTHAEGRLLQGEWKLATNYEVDDTQVLLGDLADRSAIRPGSPLSISVQDKNLSVAGGGASIPVVVTTSAGNDSEKVLLYPGTRDPSLFRGSIDTTIGVATPGNSTLELAGDDYVSYRIDPAYLRNRGLKADEPKVLKVVDDADLTVGANKETKSIKPGLPLRVKLVDRDRSRRAGASTVNVSLMTTSGDRIPAAKLKETGLCTGVFTADIKTSIPPPRAFASDSTAGAGPQDLISSTRNVVWQSLQDGEKPKFVGVDTMNSHLVQSATLAMNAPETVTRLRLFGSLYGDEILLGSYPAENTETRKGIHAISRASGARNRTDYLRELSTKIVTPTKMDGWGANHTANGHSGVRHIVRGTVFIPEDVTLRLRIKPVRPNTEKPDETIRWLTLTLYVDGVKVFGGFSEHDMNAKNRAFPVAFDAGLHDFEIYAVTYRQTDSFELCAEQDDGELVSLPKDWTDSTVHPELLARLNDKCTIARGKTGFTATFAEPERLRSLRWEFLDFTGKSVSASKLVVTDKSGREVVPSEHDYTEALGNDILEVAPGDTITVTYEDDVTSSGRSRAVERKIDSTFADGKIEFLYEDLSRDRNGRVRSEMYKAYRVAPGDALFVRIDDADLDLTPGVDSMKIVVSTTGGKKIALTATERSEKDAEGNDVVDERNAGVFYAQVRTCSAEGQPKPGMLPLAAGEGLVAAYKDEDNLDPGVPVIREAKLGAVPPNAKPELSLASTWGERGEDKSPEGKSKLLNIRRRSESANAPYVWRTSYYGEWKGPGETAVVTPDTEIPVKLHAPSLVRHAGSVVKALVATEAEIAAAETEGREVAWETRELRLRPPRMTTHVKAGPRIASTGAMKLPDSLYGAIDLYTSAAEERAAEADDEYDEYAYDKSEPVNAKAGDTIVVRVVDDDGATIAEAKATIGTTGWIGLADATYEGCNEAVHLGESFHVMVVDPDCDVSDDQDEVRLGVITKGGVKRVLTMKETMPRSGVFTCPVTPMVDSAVPTNAAPAAAAADAAPADEDPSLFPSKYGDEFTFVYKDELAGPTGTNGVRKVTGRVLPGSDGAVRAYSKRFRDADQAVLVQFRLAECLFEMAKDFRKLKDAEKSAAAIADGRKILEQALSDYPNTAHAAEGEFLLANLYEQLAEEEAQSRAEREKNGEDVSKEKDRSDPLYREAVARFSAILSAWPEGDYAARSQYHKALCLEKLKEYARASEEYVKMTYLFPESPLVGDASVRLASYYYKEQRYDIASKIYTSFRGRFPAHPQAPNALFMGGQCLVKQAEKLENAKEEVRGKSALIEDAYKDSVAAFIALVDNYKDNPNKELLAQALYWAGDISFRLKDYPNAYIYLKRTTFEYPESKWARYARGMLLQESKAFEEVAQ